MSDSLRQEFKTSTGLDIDITTRTFAHNVTHINREYVFWLEKRLSKSVVLPSDEVIKAKVDEHEQYHLVGMAEHNEKVLTIEFAAMCCSNSFDDAIRWVKKYSEKLKETTEVNENSLFVEKIETLITEWKKDNLPDEKVAFSEEAEIAAGFKFFMKWLKSKYNYEKNNK